ncbi:MAG: acetylornithine deacetylase, partial [Methylococcaceae bacterium]
MNQQLPDTLSMIADLIARPSVSSTQTEYDQSNLPVIHLLAEWMENLGFKLDIRSLSAGKANLIATLGHTDDPGGLVLSGHTDTVPCNPDRWQSDPFQATQRDNRLYGLGTADMKSFFALVLESVTRFDLKRFRKPLVILATADEESTMHGAKTLLEQNIRPGRYAVIGEPTGLKPVRMHKGIMMRAVSVLGQSGHSSNPGLGINAIEGMNTILNRLLQYRDYLRNTHINPAFTVAYPTLNIGSIHGGDNPNRICGHCETHFDVRPLPGMSLEFLDNELKNLVAEA